MNSLAVVIVSCDRYSWFRPHWYHYFNKNFGWDYPVYMIAENRAEPMENVTMIQKPMPSVSFWTKMVREAVKEIPEDHLFIMMDDFLILKDIKAELRDLYDTFCQVGADSLRIMPDMNDGCKVRPTDIGVNELLPDSTYLISFSPNIWKKSFLLKCISKDESPWDAEIRGSMRVKGGYILSTCIQDWYIGALRKGVISNRAKQLIEKI